MTHATLIFVQLIMVLMAYYLRNHWMSPPAREEEGIFRIGLPLFALAGLYAGNRLFQRRLKLAQGQATLARKLFYYRGALHYRYILWSLPSLLAVAVWFFTGTWMYLLVTALFVALLLVYRPDIDRARRELKL